MDESREALVIQFVETTGSTPDRAKFYLDSADWQIGQAIETFFDSDNSQYQDANMDDYQESGGPPQQPASGGLLDRARQAAGYLIPGLIPSSAPTPTSAPLDSNQANQRSDKGKKPTAPSTGSSRIATIGSIRGREESDEDSEEDKQERRKGRGQGFYVGSGQEVIGPGSKRNPEDIINSVFKSAKQHGAEQVDDQSLQSGSSRAPAFGGTGMRLDSSAPLGSNSAALLPNSSAGNSNSSNGSIVALRMWRNGFTIDDGPLRLYTDPANNEFMEHVKQGRVPRELVSAAKGRDLKVQMEDHRDQEYHSPKPAVQYFVGSGHMLGSPAPAVVMSTDLMKKGSIESDRKATEEKAKLAAAPNESLPTTSIQIRLADGSRLVHRFNESSTVGDIRQFVRMARPEYEALEFQILAGFPSQLLNVESVSLKDANLLNASVTVK